MLTPVSLKQWKQVAAGMAVSLGAGSQGLAAAFSSSALPQMRTPGAEFYVTEEQASLIASIFFLTSAAGGLSSGPAMNLLGRRRLLLFSSIPITMGFILVAASHDFLNMLLGRILQGFFLAISFVTATVYISESAEASIRGTIAIFPMFSFIIGNLLEYILGAVSFDWRIKTWISTTVPVTFFFSMLLVPETPRYLISKNRNEEAFKAMTWLRSSDYSIKKEILEIENSLNNADQAHSKRKCAGLLTKHNLKMYVYALALGSLYGMCGGSIVVNFAEPLLINLHTVVSPKLVSIIIGVAQVVGIGISIYLVDVVGRRRLFQISGASMAIAAFSLSLFTFVLPPEEAKSTGWGYLPAIIVILFILCFAFGVRGLPFALAADLLPTEIRGFGTGSACLCSSGTLTVLSGFFLSMMDTLKIHGTFLFFGCICLLNFLFPTLFIPETKGKSLEQLQEETKQNVFFMGLASKRTQSKIDLESNKAVECKENP